ncbi:MAG: Holliday junction DNA helicase RuvA [Pirellulaceae bacterium]|jgi:Holliday junction DNA helicase RuvA|nr:Holliday junction DNA helicase RuvA [Pirellulaceae bacterium]
MITKISGKLVALDDDAATLSIPPMEYEVLIAEFTRRHLQSQLKKEVVLHTIHYMDGNVTSGGRLTPRLVGFLSTAERDFFELFCSVDGVGVKKALRAMTQPVQDTAIMIEQQDAKGLSGLPGVGPATAERIIAKLRRKMPKFALLVRRETPSGEKIKDGVVEDTYQALLALGHNESDARQLIEQALASGDKFKDVEAMIQGIYKKKFGS